MKRFRSEMAGVESGRNWKVKSSSSAPPLSLYFQSTSSGALTRYSLGGRASSGITVTGLRSRACTSHFSSASPGKFKACR